MEILASGELPLEPSESVSIDEIVRLSAVNGPFFSHSFFPKTVRQATPRFHEEMWEGLDNPTRRYLNYIVFRDGAKTTLLRLFTAKRIAYNVSRTILYVGASEAHAARSIQWLRRQIEFNNLYRGTFDLRPGKKWQETEIEIHHGVDDQPIWVLGVGITGNIRGINFDDYRPDLIILDDILTDENSATQEQREKIANLVFGALKESLAPMSEDPNSKMAMLVTPQHREDVSSLARSDPQFYTVVAGCWTPETMDSPVEEQESSWLERYPSEVLRADKRAAIARNRLSVFLREKECRLVSPETSSFRSEWLKFYPEAEKPKGLYCILAIDPVPPPSETQMKKALRGKDYEAIVVWGRKGPDYFQLDEVTNRGHQPNWTIAKVLEFCLIYRPAAIVVEAVGYQRVLKGLLEAEMARRQIFWPVIPYVDPRAKFTRITGVFSGPASQGHIWVSEKHSLFPAQFSTYGPTYSDHDDVIDAGAIALSKLVNPYLESATEGNWNNSNVLPIKNFRRAP